jgi:hypothetical protein
VRPAAYTDVSGSNNSRPGPKKIFNAGERRQEPMRGPGSMYDRLTPAEKRREDMARADRVRRAGGEDRLFAQDRERRRVDATSRISPGVRPGYAGSTTRRTVDPVPRSDRIPRPGDFDYRAAPRRPPTVSNQSSPSYVTSNVAYEDTSSTPKSKATDRHAAQVSRHTYDRNRASQTPRLIPGGYNASLRSEPVKKGVQPIVRNGGMIRKGGKRVAKVLKRVVLPSTIRLENLTNLLGVKLCKQRLHHLILG